MIRHNAAHNKETKHNKAQDRQSAPTEQNEVNRRAKCLLESNYTCTIHYVMYISL